MEILERKGTIIKRRSSVDGVEWGAEKEPVSRMRAEREGRGLETTQRGNSKGDAVAPRCTSRRTHKMEPETESLGLSGQLVLSNHWVLGLVRDSPSQKVR